MFDLKKKLDDEVNLFLTEDTEEEKKFLDKLLTYQYAVNKLSVLLSNQCKGKRMALFGNGAITREFVYALGVPENLICIIDRKNKKPLFWKLEHIPVISMEELPKYHIDMILIPSMIYEEEMREELCNEHFKGEIIGIHSWLKRQGIVLDKEFIWYKGEDKYNVINRAYCDFLETGDKKKIECVILGLLHIRDYPHAIQLIQKYLDENEESSYFKLKQKIEQIFNEVRTSILKITRPHIMMYVVDSLAQNELKHMSLLKKIVEENFSFDTLMTQYGSTRESIVSLLTGYQIIKNKLYERRYVTKKDGDLLSYLSEKGYSVNIFFDRHEYALSKMDDLESSCTTNISTELFFDGLCALLNSEESTFNYMHTLAELHSPFYNPLYGKELLQYNKKYYFDNFVEQYRSSEKYIDEILYFYHNLLKNSQVIQIILGDHGIILEEIFQECYESQDERKYFPRWEREKNNPVCVIIDTTLGQGENENVVCNYSLAKILRRVLEKNITAKELRQYDDKYVQLEMIPIYDKNHIHRMEKCGYSEWILGGVGIWTKEDVFMRLETQEERYFIHGIEDNLIYDERYKEKVAEYRKILADNHGIEEMLELDRFSYHKEYVKKFYQNR